MADEFNDDIRLLAAKEYLNDIQKYREIVEKYESKIDFYKRKAYSIGGYRYDQTKVQASTEKGAAYEGYLMKLEEWKKRYSQKYFLWKSKALNPLISIGKLNNLDYQYLLRLRFSSCKSWKEIQDGLQCDDLEEARNQAFIALSYIMEKEGKLQLYADLALKAVI